MHSQSTTAVAISILLAAAPVAQGAAHLRPYANGKAQLEAREPQFNFGSWLNNVFGGGAYSLPALPKPTFALPTFPGFPGIPGPVKTTSTTVKLTTTSSLPTKTSTSTKATSTSTTSVSVKASSTASSAVVSKSASASTASVKTSTSSSKTTVVPVTSSTSKTTTAPATSSTSKTTTAPVTSTSKTTTTAPVTSSTSKTTSVVPRSSSGSACPIPRISRTSGSSGISVSTNAASTSATTKSTTAAVTSSKTTTAPVTSTSVSKASLTGPSVTVSAGTIVGTSLPNGVEQYLGIPYAQPPVGQLRLKPPVAYSGSFGVLNATTPPPSCPQLAQALTGNYSAGGLQPFIDEFVFTKTVEQEDCLTLSIWRPNNTTPNTKLPVVYWIYGGGFQFGATSMYNGSSIVARSVLLGSPIIFVEVNYRVGGFGFLAGADLASEVSTNLGLRDQRLGMQWTADNIGAFGGDNSKVTLWGESAGAISVNFHTTVNGGDNTYKGKPLFRATIHNSGSFAPADNVTAPQAQAVYDQVVSQAGCSRSTAAARLACLRSVDFNVLRNATNSVPGFGTYRSADLPYLPRPDQGDAFYSQTAEISVAFGQWTKTPHISGNQKDEGTILAIVQNNITNNDQLVQYLSTWFPNNPNAVSDVAGLAALYPDNATAGQPDGSPYDTGSDNNIYPQFKRLAAILGDIVFIITRRAFLNLSTGQGVKAWSYQASYLSGLPTYGTLHGSDLAYLFDPIFTEFTATRSIQSYYIGFIANLDPNSVASPDTTVSWPQWTNDAPVSLEFTGGGPQYLNDTFRAPVYNYLLTKVFGFRV